MTPLYHSLKSQSPDYERYLHHALVQRISDGTLPQGVFIFFLKQDYVFLTCLARALGLAVYKSQSMTLLRSAQTILNKILDVEIRLHIEHCKGFGISEKMLAEVPQDPVTLAYTRYLFEHAQSDLSGDIYIAMSPCLLGYGDIGRRIKASGKVNPKNPYNDWIEMYSSDAYLDTGNILNDCLDRISSKASPETQARWQKIFNNAVRMEIAFWQMCFDAQS